MHVFKTNLYLLRGKSYKNIYTYGYHQKKIQIQICVNTLLFEITMLNKHHIYLHAHIVENKQVFS